MILKHTFQPVYNAGSEILILGTFPSVKSRENKFYYGHCQNRFWQVLAAVYDCEKPQSINEKISFLLSNGIALWDVIQSCEISGSSDSSIKNVTYNDINKILSNCNIKNIYANGKIAEKLYVNHLMQITNRGIIMLPSTSSANASWSTEKLKDEWRRLVRYWE